MIYILLTIDTVLLFYLVFFREKNPIYISNTPQLSSLKSDLPWFSSPGGEIVRKEITLPDNIDDLLT